MIAALLANPAVLRALQWGAVALAVAAVLLGARNAGRREERVENLERAVEAARRRRDVDVEVGRARPDDVRDELHRDWSRD